MVLPTTAYTVGVVLVLVLPGVVYATVRTRVLGIRPQDRDVPARVLEALLVSASLDAIYLLVLGDVAVELVTVGPGGAPNNPRLSAAAGLLLGGVVPGLLAYVIHGTPWARKLLDLRGLRWMHVPRAATTYDPIPTAWDWAARRPGSYWVRVRIGEGTWVGGWYGSRSFVSTYPESRDIFIQDQHHVDELGEISDRIKGSAGVWLALKDGDIVEWVKPYGEDDSSGQDE